MMCVDGHADKRVGETDAADWNRECLHVNGVVAPDDLELVGASAEPSELKKAVGIGIHGSAVDELNADA